MTALLNNRYRVLRPIGAGSQGSVLLAEDTRQEDAQVALKMVERSSRSGLIEEFERLVQLHHVGLAQVHELLVADRSDPLVAEGSLYFVSEFVDGSSLEDALEDASPDRLLDICAQLAAACSYLHARGLVHADIKPDNMRLAGDERVVLLDLGLSRPAGQGEASGSMAYMAPEALCGYVDARSDLYSLGAAMIEIASGERLFPEENRQALLDAILDPPAGRVQSLLQTYPPSIVDLLAQLVSVDPGARPSGANALLADIERVAEGLGTPLPSLRMTSNFSRPEFVGRAEELATLGQRLHTHAKSQDGGVVHVTGERGSGRRRLVEEAIWRHRVEAARGRTPALRVRTGPVDELWNSDQRRAEDFFATWVDRGSDPGLAVVFDDGDPRYSDFIGAGSESGVMIIACHAGGVPTGTGDLVITLPALSSQQSGALCQSLSAQPVPESWRARVRELSRSLPGRLVDFMRAAATLDPSHTESPDQLLIDGSLSASLVRRVAHLGKDTANIVEHLAVANRALTIQQLSDIVGAERGALTCSLHELLDAGLICLVGDSVSCVSAEQARIIVERTTGPRRKSLHRRVYRALADDMSLAERAAHLLVIGPAPEAATAALLAIKDRQAVGRHNQALALCLASVKQMAGKNASLHAALTAELALTTGDYQLASKFAEKAKRSRDPLLHRRGVHALARGAQHDGESAKAARLLAALVAAQPHDAQAHATYAKILLAQGRLSEAGDAARAALQCKATAPDRFLATEVAGLALLYAGALEECETFLGQLKNIATDPPNPRLMGRAQGLLGMLRQKQARLGEAAQLYAEAAAKSAESGALHAAAVFHLNGATVQQRSARYAEALASLESAQSALRRSGTPFELAAAHCNRGNLLLMLGEIASAAAEAKRAQSLADLASEPRICIFAHLLQGDVALRQQSLGPARAHFQDALVLATEHALSDGVHAAMRIAEIDAIKGIRSDTESISAARALVHGSEELRSEVIASDLRVQLALGQVSDEMREAAAALRDQLIAAEDLDLGWRVAVLVARACAALGDQGAEEALSKAEQLFKTIHARSPEAYRNGLSRHPDAQTLQVLLRPQRPDNQRNGPQRDTSGKMSEAPLRRLLALGRRLNSELRLEPLLDDIIDTAIELSRAERAFLLLRNGDGALEVRVARNIDRRDLGNEDQVSRTIAENVAVGGQVILTVDAEEDTRFGASLSVAALRLRSILAVPFRVKSRIVGTLYLDHRFRRGAFDDEAVELVRELADIAAVALENARLATDNRRRQLEIEKLNGKLEARLEDTEAHLASARACLPAGRAADGFGSIIGDSEPMQALIALAERAAACDLPVVIAGDSGTGKELLARAIHDNGSRRSEAFVALNCGAVPDNLLEAELFGHEKGAFTGADRARRGLFQVAHGGTLFLDEIADTSLAMQSKLLRALQGGEIRPLGAEQSVHVDIRVVCASNQELEPLVASGQFREDLYYRLSVLKLPVPRLRERRSDIQAIAEHILERIGNQEGMSAATLRALQAYRWPGNVRELENELTRASALSEMKKLEPPHLSPALQRAQGEPDLHPGDALLLKPRVEELERNLVEEAMRQTGGNQSKAAILLGLSRYGLQKKLHRYGIEITR